MKNLLLSLALFLLPGNIAIHSTESGSSSPSWIEILESDFSSFRGEYNNLILNDCSLDSERKEERFLNADSIEEMSDILILQYEQRQENEIDGYFVDFNEDNGYRVVDEGGTIYDIVVKGESPFTLLPEYKHAYMEGAGYFYLDDDSQWIWADGTENTDEEFWENTNLYEKHYSGQRSNSIGCGNIDKPEEYNASKYGDGYELVDSCVLPRFPYNQFDLSCYIENQENNTGTLSEGNCWVVSAYHILQYFADEYWLDVPESGECETYDPKESEPRIYGLHFNSDGVCQEKVNIGTSIKDKYELNEPLYFPKLYIQVRQLVEANYGKIDGGTIFQTNYIVTKTALDYGHYQLVGYTHLPYRFYYRMIMEGLVTGLPAIWSTANDTYGPHTMAVSGYRVYQKTDSFLGFQIDYKKIYFEIKDGHTTEGTFFDRTGFHGIGAFITFELNS